MAKRPIPPRHTAYPRRPPEPKPFPEARPPAERSSRWARVVPSGRRFPRV